MNDTGFGMYAALVIGGLSLLVLVFVSIKALIYSIKFLFKQGK
jgi:hypothetical protein